MREIIFLVFLLLMSTKARGGPSISLMDFVMVQAGFANSLSLSYF
jgi:hypothetical protein